MRVLMTSRNRLVLMLCVALAGAAFVGTPSFAQGLSAPSGKIIQLTRAGKYAEALPLAQAMVAQLEKGPPNRDLSPAPSIISRRCTATWAAMPRLSPSTSARSPSWRNRPASIPPTSRQS
jgi:hypothetical protein